MEKPSPLLRFLVDDRLFGLELAAVDRVVRMVEMAPLPAAPDVIEGMVDVAGEIIPVLSVRRRFGLPPREADAGQSLILARTSRRRVALPADEVTGVDPAASIIPGEQIPAPSAAIKGVVQTEEGLIVIQDLENFLFPPEETALKEALPEKE